MGLSIQDNALKNIRTDVGVGRVTGYTVYGSLGLGDPSPIVQS